MPKSMSIIEARKMLTAIPELFDRESDMDAVAVTRRGKPVMAILPWDLYESLTETLEIIADEALMAELRRSIAEVKAGKALPWKTAKTGLMK